MNYYPINDSQGFKRCAGKGCSKIAKHYLQIKYIKKSGWFCDPCAEDLKTNDLILLWPTISTDEIVDSKIKEL